MGPSSFGLYCSLEIIYALIATALVFQSLANISGAYGRDSYWYLFFIPVTLAHGALLIFNGVRKEISAKAVSFMLIIAYGAYITWPFSEGAQLSAIPWSWLFGTYAMLVPAFEETSRGSYLHNFAIPSSLIASSFAAHWLTGAP